jgi:DNA-directed RNA polymerase specialized sigma24 family protein
LQTEVESPESALLSSEMEIAIRRAIEALPLRLRSPFTLRREAKLPLPKMRTASRIPAGSPVYRFLFSQGLFPRGAGALPQAVC